MNKSIEAKVTELLEKSNLIENLPRKKFVSMFVLALIASRSVQFHEVSLHVNTDAKPESTERRIQSFFKDFSFDYDITGLVHKKLNLIFEQCIVSILLTNFVFDEASKMLALLCLRRPAKIHALKW